MCSELFADPAQRGQIIVVWDFFEEGLSSVFGGPLVGFLSEYLGYRFVKGERPSVESNEALGHAILGVCTISWILAGTFWTLQYNAFPADLLAMKEKKAGHGDFELTADVVPLTSVLGKTMAEDRAAFGGSDLEDEEFGLPDL